ncbi:MAG: VWA domain-containing protein [Variovorax sp.]|nr:MAG: VWA domain-containing protein [Variovorax sp.]
MAARGAEPLRAEHLRHRAPSAPGGALHCFVLDCSGSMRTDDRLAQAKGVLLSLMDEAYRRRDAVALLCFGGDTVELRVPPQRAAAWNDAWVAPIGGGGGTPLAAAVQRADALLARQTGCVRWLWLLSDGRSTEAPPRPVSAERLIVLDFETGRGALGRAAQLAERWAPCRHLRSWEAGIATAAPG